MAWQERAACRGMNPELFYDERGGATVYDQARAVCAVCEVRSDCLNQALEDCEDFGMWGGLTVKERDRINGVRLRRVDTLGPTRHYAVCGTESGYRRHRKHGEEACEGCKDAHNIAKKARAQRLRMEVA